MNWTFPKNEIVAVVIPCYKVKKHINHVLNQIPEFVHFVYCVDDACPEQSGIHIQNSIHDPRIKVIFNSKNLGVGGATMEGFKAALKNKATLIVKIDGDGQMDPSLIATFLRPISLGIADYCKGNRFFEIEYLITMPKVRIFGNAVLSFLTKLSSGYWNIFDPNNGFIAIHHSILSILPLHKINQRFFFESDILFRLNIIGAVTLDIPMQAVYKDEESNLKITKIIFPFIKGHFINFSKRIFYNYFLRDFQIASVYLILGIFLLLLGIIFGGIKFIESYTTHIPATAGTVMFSALPILIGLQFMISFLQYDIAAVPKQPKQYCIKDN